MSKIHVAHTPKIGVHQGVKIGNLGSRDPKMDPQDLKMGSRDPKTDPQDPKMAKMAIWGSRGPGSGQPPNYEQASLAGTGSQVLEPKMAILAILAQNSKNWPKMAKMAKMTKNGHFAKPGQAASRVLGPY